MIVRISERSKSKRRKNPLSAYLYDDMLLLSHTSNLRVNESLSITDLRMLYTSHTAGELSDYIYAHSRLKYGELSKDPLYTFDIRYECADNLALIYRET